MKLLYVAEFYRGRNLLFSVEADTEEQLNRKIRVAKANSADLKEATIRHNKKVVVGTDPAKDMQEILRLTNLNKKEFAHRYQVEYRTLLTWLNGDRDASEFARCQLYYRVITDEERGNLKW